MVRIRRRFPSGGKRQPIPLARLSGQKTSTRLAPWNSDRRSVHFDSVPLSRRSGTRPKLSTATVFTEQNFWFTRSSNVGTEPRFGNPSTVRKNWEAALLPRAVVEGISVDEPFPFLLYGHAARVAGRFFCDPDHQHGRDLSEKAKSCFSIEKESIEIIDSTR